MHNKPFCLISRVFALLCISFLLAACTSGKTTVLKPLDTPRSYSTLTLREGEFTGGEVSVENRGKLRQALASRLYGLEKFTEGSDLTLTYRVIQYDKGSRSARYWSSGFGGAGTLTIEVTYTDKAGGELSRGNFEGKVSSGAFGGDFSGAIDAVASQIAAYTHKNFRVKPAINPSAQP